MPIYIKQNKDQTKKSGPLFENNESKTKQLAILLQQQLRQTMAKLKQVKFERNRLEHEVARKDAEINRLKHELARLSRGKNNVGNDFGDF